MENDDSTIESLIQRYMGKTEISNKIQDMLNNNQHRLTLNLDDMRNFSTKLTSEVLKNPLKWLDYIQNHLSNTA